MRYLTMLVLLMGLIMLQADAPPAEANHTIAHRVTSLESTVSSLGDRVDDVEDDITAVEDDITDLDGRVDGVESSVDDIDTNVGTLLDRTDNLPGKLATLQTSVGDVPEVVQNMREGRGKVTQDMLDALDDAVVVLQQEIIEERNGLAAFRGSNGDCSSTECIQFRSDMSMLLTNMENLSNTLIEVDPGLGIGAQIDLNTTRTLVQTLPAAGLYPLYRATNRDSNVFGSGIVQLLGDLDDDIRGVAVGTRTGSAAGASSLAVGTPAGSAIDALTQCGQIMQDPFLYEAMARRVHSAGLVTKGIGKLLEAWGGTRVIDKEIQIHGYVGYAVKNNYRKKAGLIIGELLGDSLIALGSYGFGKLRYCTTLDATERCEIELEVEPWKKNEDLVLFVLTTRRGDRTSVVDEFKVFVDTLQLPPGTYNRQEHLPGVWRVTVNSEALPGSGQSFLMTVEATTPGQLTAKTCSNFTIVPGNVPQQGGPPGGSPQGRG